MPEPTQESSATGKPPAGGVNIGGVSGDIRDAVIVGRDLVLQVMQQARLELPERNLAGQAAILTQALPHLDPLSKLTAQAAIQKLKEALAALPEREQAYRGRIRARYGEDAPYYVPLSGETTEAQAGPMDQSSRSERRRRQRAVAGFHEWIQAGPELKRIKLNTLRQGVDKYPCLILLGDPGSGKTTALEHLAYEFAGEAGKMPLVARLSSFGPGLTVDELLIRGLESPDVAANLEGYLEAGHLFCLFDALNEMPREDYKERALELRRFIDCWQAKGNRFVVTCRVLDYGEELSGLQRIEVQPLSDGQIQTLLQKELPEQWPAVWQLLQGAANTSATGGRQRANLIEMARNPYILTMMIDVFDEDQALGENRARLMERFTQILFQREQVKWPVLAWLDAAVQTEALAAMAFGMQAGSGSGVHERSVSELEI